MDINLEIKPYLESRLLEQGDILALYLQDRKSRSFLERDLYHKIEIKIQKFLNEDSELRWLTIPGLRGTGKTTALAQIYFKYSKSFGKRILFLSVDEIKSKLNSNLYEVLDKYEEILRTSFSKLKEPVLLLLDEVHYDPDWAIALKNLFDKSRNVFIISTGSSAISLSVNPDIARRTFIIPSYPLSFNEYIFITQKTSTSRKKLERISNELQEIIFYENKLELAYNKLQNLESDILTVLKDLDKFELLNFLQLYSLPSVLKLDNQTEIYQNLNSTIQRITSSDLSCIKTYNQDIVFKIENLLFLLASSELSSLQTLSSQLNININTLSSIFDTLLKSQLLIKVPAYGSAAKQIRKSSKYIFSAPAIRASLTSILGLSVIDKIKGKLLEDFVVSSFKRKIETTNLIQLSYDANKIGADLIYQSPTVKYAIEIGWNKKSYAQVIETMKRTKIKSGMLLTNTSLNYNAEHNILTFPIEWFALL